MLAEPQFGGDDQLVGPPHLRCADPAVRYRRCNRVDDAVGNGRAASLGMGGDELPRVEDHLVGVGGETAAAPADLRVAGVDVEVDDRAEIDVEAEAGKFLRCTDIELVCLVEAEPGNLRRAGQADKTFGPGEALNDAAFL